jgi:hypothetical protein
MVNLALPFALREASTFLPFFVAILERNPCLFFLFLLEGWNVLFIRLSYFFLRCMKLATITCYCKNNPVHVTPPVYMLYFCLFFIPGCKIR